MNRGLRTTRNRGKVKRIHAVAMERRRFGYRRVHDMLRTELPGTNHKKVFRLYSAQGLAVRKRNKGKKCRGERTPLVAATRVNQTWSLDFVSDSLANGRRDVAPVFQSPS